MKNQPITAQPAEWQAYIQQPEVVAVFAANRDEFGLEYAQGYRKACFHTGQRLTGQPGGVSGVFEDRGDFAPLTREREGAIAGYVEQRYGESIRSAVASILGGAKAAPVPSVADMAEAVRKTDFSEVQATIDQSLAQLATERHVSREQLLTPLGPVRR